jgi:hypothetical protein
MPYNYWYSFNNKSLALIFHVEIGGLTQSGWCFTLEKLERHRKTKGKEIVYTSDKIKAI